jgi:hypothetical protein
VTEWNTSGLRAFGADFGAARGGYHRRRSRLLAILDKFGIGCVPPSKLGPPRSSARLRNWWIGFEVEQNERDYRERIVRRSTGYRTSPDITTSLIAVRLGVVNGSTVTKTAVGGAQVILLTLAAGQFLMTLDSSVMNVSIVSAAGTPHENIRDTCK